MDVGCCIAFVGSWHELPVPARQSPTDAAAVCAGLHKLAFARHRSRYNVS